MLSVFLQLAIAGLALVYVIQTMALTQYTVRKTADVENYMTSVERVMTYTKLDSEPGYRVSQQRCGLAKEISPSETCQ